MGKSGRTFLRGFRSTLNAAAYFPCFRIFSFFSSRFSFTGHLPAELSDRFLVSGSLDDLSIEKEALLGNPGFDFRVDFRQGPLLLLAEHRGRLMFFQSSHGQFVS